MQQYSHKQRLTSALRAAFGGASVALLLGTGLLTMTPQAARAQATAGDTFTTLYGFGTNAGDGEYPECGLVQGADGNFYGTTVNGGASNDGTVFKVTPSGTLTTLYTFAGTDGGLPQASLIVGADGNFYGTTGIGGAYGSGVIFKITPSGTYTLLYSFTATNSNDNADGNEPLAPLVLGSDGNFYGTASQGGTNGEGTVFKITPAGVFTTLYSFTGGNDGYGPEAGLVEGSDGNFYGTCVEGGTTGYGTAFQITPAGALTTLHAFANSEGVYPYGTLAKGADGAFLRVDELQRRERIWNSVQDNPIRRFYCAALVHSFRSRRFVQRNDRRHGRQLLWNVVRRRGQR